MILGETAPLFLGFGLRPSITSWGMLLTEAQNINVVALYPWLMLPVVPVICVDFWPSTFWATACEMPLILTRDAMSTDR